MTEPLPAPLDPDGLVWEHFGRLPIFRLSNGLREAMLQNMHPELAAGVELQSNFFSDPLARGQRSIGPIMNWMCCSPPEATGSGSLSATSLLAAAASN